ncbi:hypothetical protein ACTXT7_015238 [Hymenolepis weldensis]
MEFVILWHDEQQRLPVPNFQCLNCKRQRSDSVVPYFYHTFILLSVLQPPPANSYSQTLHSASLYLQLLLPPTMQPSLFLSLSAKSR